jgi:hypothetical protein
VAGRPRKSGVGLSAAERSANRERIQEVVDENLETHLQALLDQAANASREDWVLCPYCDRKHVVVRPDYRAQESAIRTLHELGYGRPKVEGEAGGAGFILKRVIVYPGGVEVEGENGLDNAA